MFVRQIFITNEQYVERDKGVLGNTGGSAGYSSSNERSTEKLNKVTNHPILFNLFKVL